MKKEFHYILASWFSGVEGTTSVYGVGPVVEGQAFDAVAQSSIQPGNEEEK